MKKLKIFSRHPSHNPLREIGLMLPVRACIRLGSVTDWDKGVQINTADAVHISCNKLLMKDKFTKAEVKSTAWWAVGSDGNEDFFVPNGNLNAEDLFKEYEKLPYPIVAKHIFGSRGTGNYKLDNKEQFEKWLEGKELHKYIFESFFNGSREYRLHVTEDGCFYTCRKMLKQDAQKRWYRNNDNCVWVMEDNPLFDKPSNWDDVVKESVKALKAVGLDVGALDVRIQSNKNKKGEVREYPEFVILETNSAPSFGKVTFEKYKEEIPKIITSKLNKCQLQE